MPRTDFVHLHVHGENSLLDGMATSPGYVNRAKELGQPALALTDHGQLCGLPEFYKAARKADIEPLLGCEFYYLPSYEEARNQKDAERYHLTVLARGARGYEVLSELNTATFGQFYYKPILDRNLIESLGEDAQHLTVLSGCAGSRLSRLLLDGEEDTARAELMWWREMFPNYYIELMHHGTAFDKTLNEALIELATRYNIPHVITNDPHYVMPEDAPHHDALLAVQTAADIDDPNRFKFDGEGYWLKSRSEMRATMRQYGEYIWKAGAANTLAIARESVTRVPAWESKTWQIPKFPDVDDAQAEVKRICYRRLRELGLRDDDTYVTQLKHELRTVRQVGIADFLMITREAILWAAEHGIRVGPGRGSVAGSLVAYLLGIHKVDPIKYKLLFERFLNPARPKMPDIDTDFSQERRGEVIEHCVQKYGTENTMHVAAFGRMKVKAAFNMLSKSFGIGYVDAQRLNKEILEESEDTEDPDSARIYLLPPEVDEAYPRLAGHLNALAGLKRSVSAHPAGIIIAAPEHRIRSQVPEMYIPSSKRWVGQFDKKAVEAMGFLKQDFLGLRTLDTIDQAVRLIARTRGIQLDPDAWVPDEEEHDAEVYKMIASGRTAGVFQMEGPTNQRGCRDVRPKCFEDLVSITSLYRTGAISAGFPKIFNENRARGQRHITYAHPKLKPILKDTWGVVLYQEQVMEIGRSLAGFSMVQVDEIKEAIKDKSSDEMAALKPVFIDGCRTVSGIARAQAEEIWKMIEGYAGYGYNRSHAVAYTLLTYQTARLKYLYPLEYTAALLRTVPNDKTGSEKRDTYMRELIEFSDSTILPPDINISDHGATPDLAANALRFGIADLTGIGDKQATKILEGRPAGGYTTVDEVAAAARNSGVLRVLGDAGALESLGVPGDPDRQEQLLRWVFRDNMAPYREQYAGQVVLPSSGLDDVVIVGELFNITKGKTKTGKDYLTWKLRWSVTEAFDVRLWSETSRFWDLKEGSIIMVAGEWESRWLNISCGNPRNIEIIKAVR